MTKECSSSEQAYRGHVGEIVREHRELIEAIRDRDGDRSEVARSHADLARKRVSESLTQIMTRDGSPAWRTDEPAICEDCAIFAASTGATSAAFATNA
jgi:hypothetical protein